MPFDGNPFSQRRFSPSLVVEGVCFFEKVLVDREREREHPQSFEIHHRNLPMFKTIICSCASIIPLTSALFLLLASTILTHPATHQQESPRLNGRETFFPASDVTKQGCVWNVDGVGSFNNMASYTFTGNSLPTGLTASDYGVDDSVGGSGIPYSHQFDPSNVAIADGALMLTVPGGQSPGNGGYVQCAEVTTDINNIRYASTRVVAWFSGVEGTCQSESSPSSDMVSHSQDQSGHFFYKSDQQEIDIEWLSDPSSQSNNGPGSPIPFWYTNQALIAGNEPTHQNIPPAISPTAGWHEYRIDWTPAHTAFYIDGVQQGNKLTTNVPTMGGTWVFNNWANGDPGWTVGPPTQDSVFRVQSITMYYNTTNKANSC